MVHDMELGSFVQAYNKNLSGFKMFQKQNQETVIEFHSEQNEHNCDGIERTQAGLLLKNQTTTFFKEKTFGTTFFKQ